MGRNHTFFLTLKKYIERELGRSLKQKEEEVVNEILLKQWRMNINTKNNSARTNK